METSSIELTGAQIDRIEFADGTVRLHFPRVHIVKSMTGSAERTRWWQAGDLVLEDAEVEGDIPTGPLVCAGGDVGENVYTYRDMIPVPLASRGHAHCALSFEGTGHKLVARGSGVRLEMIATPKYIEHLRPG